MERLPAVRRLDGARALVLSMMQRTRGTERVGSFTSGALLANALLVFAAKVPFANIEMPWKPVQPGVVVPRAPAGPSTLDRLRDEAAIGDDLANRQLSIALLDRYDLTGDPDDFYEAVLWIDRRWSASGNGELVARIAAHHCQQRVVRWHWFCLPRE
jgi:hypothetical protein